MPFNANPASSATNSPTPIIGTNNIPANRNTVTIPSLDKGTPYLVITAPLTDSWCSARRYVGLGRLAQHWTRHAWSAQWTQSLGTYYVVYIHLYLGAVTHPLASLAHRRTCCPEPARTRALVDCLVPLVPVLHLQIFKSVLNSRTVPRRLAVDCLIWASVNHLLALVPIPCQICRTCQECPQ